MLSICLNLSSRLQFSQIFLLNFVSTDGAGNYESLRGSFDTTIKTNYPYISNQLPEASQQHTSWHCNPETIHKHEVKPEIIRLWAIIYFSSIKIVEQALSSKLAL
jgi:hypothetical protein